LSHGRIEHDNQVTAQQVAPPPLSLIGSPM
jgi:hypothetical protein